MAGKSSNNGNWAPNSPATRYKASGKNREFYTFENAPGLGNYATGGTIIDGGDGYIYHIFTGTGTFAIPASIPSSLIDSVDYLIVAGGGAIAPGTSPASGGGGGGGMLFGTASLPNGSYPINVGGGGPAVANVPTTAGTQRNGNPSSAFGLTATGGGSGGNATPGSNGRPGGSGGGGSFPGGTGGTGNTPATIPRQGYSGATPNGGSSGGGGAGGVGVAGGPTTPQVGAGGPGRLDPNFPLAIISKAFPAPISSAFNTALTNFSGFAAGGCGTDPSGNIPAPFTRTNPQNSGFGGQAGANSGGSGIVCVRYKKTAAYSRATGGIVEPSATAGHLGVVRHIFTSPGNFTVADPTLQWIDYLAVGGGGGGGNGAGLNNAGGGAGAGGFVTSIEASTTTPTTIPEAYPWNPGYSVGVGEQYPVGTATYPIDIGTGGTAGTAGNNTTIGNPGGTQIIAYGGGAGGSNSNGGNGASGGGASKFAPSVTTRAGGTATPTPLIQGNPGGGPTPATPGSGSAFGGGGAGGVASGFGGAGWYSVLSPSSYGTPGPVSGYRYFAGGGGGGFASSPSGGAGGGGNASSNGTTNTGGGGGGGAPSPTPISGGTGGPGIVIIQYPE